MERKLLSLPSFFVLLLIAGIAFLAAPVVEVEAAAPTVDASRSGVRLVGTNLIFTLTFSQAVDYDASVTDDADHFGFQDLVLTGAPSNTLSAGAVTPAPADLLTGIVANQSFRVVVGAPTSGAGTVVLAIRASTAGDFMSVGTAPGAYVHQTPADSLSYEYDLSAPTVTIAAGAGVTSDTATGVFQVTFAFSEALGDDAAGFEMADIMLTVGQPTPAINPPATATATLISKTQSASTADDATEEEQQEIWLAAISPGAGATSVKIEVKKESVADAAGNEIVAASATANTAITVTIDNVPPAVAISGPTTGENQVDPFQVMFTITGDVGDGDGDGLEADDIVVLNGDLQEGSLKPNLLTAGSEYTAMVAPNGQASPLKVTVTAGALEDDAGNSSIEVSADFVVNVPPPSGPTEPAQKGNETATGFTVDLNVPANGFVVLARSGDVAHHGILSGVTVLDIKDNAWEDLYAFMGIGPGGAIDLLAPTGTVSTVRDALAANPSQDLVISEIMWGSDDGLGTTAAERMNSQWIELYNTTSAAITGTWELQFKKSDTGVGITTSTLADKFTNFGLTQSHQFWNIPDAAGGAYGQSGRTSSSGTNIGTIRRLVSMERKIDFAKVRKGDHDSSNAAKNRTKQLEGVPDGALSGSWQASKDPQGSYLTGRRLGTPGAGPLVVVSTTKISKSVVFNEIANRTGDSGKFDWIELYNPGSSDVKINNWVLSKVTKVDTDDKLFKFESDENIVVPAKGFLLVANEDPSETALAAGKNVDNPNSKANSLPTEIYIDSGLKIPKEKYLLVLRTEEKLKSDEKIVDIAGHIGDLDLSDSGRATDLWPLKAWNAIKTDDLKEDDGKTWVRDKGKNLDHGDAWKLDGGFTGLGIDRNPDSSKGPTSGTPGFDNGAVKDKAKDLTASDPVVISEIMFGTSERGRTPQWIELYNPSETQAVKLHNWRLEVQNTTIDPTENLDVEAHYTLILPDKRIQPKQTILIVSASARESTRDRFPSDRIINIWSTRTLRETVEMSSARDAILSSVAFNIKLSDPDKTVVDEVGNIMRARDTRDWDLPGGLLDDDVRASMMRRKGTFGDGTEADAWISAAVVDPQQKVGINELYYGNEGDLGTPGYRAGGPLPVQLSSFYSKRNDTGAVVITWSTESELDNAGFNILRSQSRTGEFVRINAQLIPGAGTTGEKTAYTWTDTSAKPNVLYFYQIEDVSLAGDHRTLRTTRLRGYIGAAGKAATTWGDLKSRE